MARSSCFALALLICAAANAVAGPNSSVVPVPAATFSQSQCTGFISGSDLSGAIRVFNGADNVPDVTLRGFTPGDYVYLRRSDGQPFRVGQAFSTVRPENGFGLNPAWLPGKIGNQILPPASVYRFQRYQIEKLGRPYENTGLVRVIRVTPQGAIARVVFICGGIYPEDIAVRYEPEAIPLYLPSTRLDLFAPPNGKLQGTIVAESIPSAYLARGSMAFLDIGQTQGVAAGQRYRIFAVSRDNPVMGLEGIFPPPATPRETVGELVILHVRHKSSVGIVVNSLRQIDVGDGVERE
ncbi:MAG: hypothetical protein ACRD10_10475 [Terriglobia bacterium]